MEEYKYSLHVRFYGLCTRFYDKFYYSTFIIKIRHKLIYREIKHHLINNYQIKNFVIHNQDV